MKNKKTLWIIIGVIILVVSLILMTRKEQTFKVISFSNNNIIGNRATKTYLDTIASVGLDIMEIKGVSVLIQDMKEKISINGDIDVKAYIIGKNKQYIIYVNKTMSRDMAIEIIAHEIIHLFQTEKFKLVKFKDSLMWDNTIYKDPQNIPYMDREWEREAFTYGRLLEKEIKEKLYE